MKLGLGLDVRKASAPAFKGLLDKFTGAVAAYSTRKLTASQPNILPADYGDGAAAAYSLRKVKASYSGNCIDVRRSSDDTTSSIGFSGNELDTTALEAFVNEEITIATSDFSGATPSPTFAQSNVSISSNESVLGVDDTLKITLSGGASSHYIYAAGVTIGQEYKITFDYYIPSGQTLNYVRVGVGSPETTFDTTGEWVTGASFTQVAAQVFYIFRFTSSAADDDVFYLKNIVVTQTTADGFVTKWYDQSGTNHAEQSTDNDQPQIVDAGSTILENGKPAIQFDGVDDYLFANQLDFDNEFIVSTTKAGGFARMLNARYNGDNVVMIVNGRYRRNTNDLSFNGALFDIKLNQQTLLSGLNQTTLYQDGTLITALDNTSITYGNTDGIFIGIEADLTNEWQGAFQELILFDSDQSDNRQDIEWNINNHYNIYTDSWDKQSAMEVRRAIDNETTNIGFVGKDLDTTALETFATESSPVLDDYTGAAAAYSLRKVRSAYTGSAVRVRRSSDDTEQDIGFDSNGDLDSTALLAFVNEETTFLNDTFDGSYSYTAAVGSASVTGGVLDFPDTSNTIVFTSLTNTLKTQQVRVTFTILNYVSGDIKFENYSSGAQGTTRSANGTYVETLTIASSGNNNFGFSGTMQGQIDDFKIEQLTADGAVTTWYDQSGNGNDATNSTASEQPLVVSGGTLLEENGKAIIQRVDNSSTLKTSYAPNDGAATKTMIFVGNVSPTRGALIGSSTGSSDYILFSQDGSGVNILNNNATLSNEYLNGNSWVYADRNDVYDDLTSQGLVFANVQFSFSVNDMCLGYQADVTSNTNMMNYQELIIFDSDQSANRTGIEGNIGRYYNIDGFRDVFVSKWYDQSGNFNHAENSTDTQQPQIVDGGSVITEGTTPKAAMNFDGVDDNFRTTLSQGGIYNAFVVHTVEDTTFPIILGSEDSSNRILIIDNTNENYYQYIEGTQTLRTPNNSVVFGQQALVNVLKDVTITDSYIYKDGVLIDNTSLTSSDNTANIQIGAEDGNNADFPYEGTMQEVILFNSDQSDNRTGIENNINKHFKIYE